jgi:flagellar motor component MotA
VKIKVIHAECGREALVRQILDMGGHCPWDGKPYNKDYTAVLAEALEGAEEAGNVLENALEKIAEMGPAMSIDRGSVFGVIEMHLASLNQRHQGTKR